MKIWVAAVTAIMIVLGCDSKVETPKPVLDQAKQAPMVSATTVPFDAGAANWVKVEGGAKTVDRTVYIDAASAADQDKYRKVWVMSDSLGDQDIPGGTVKFRSKREYYLILCQEKSWARSEETFYKGGMLQGEVVSTRKIDNTRWFPATAGSVVEATMDTACKLTPRTSASAPAEQPIQVAAAPSWTLAGSVQGGKIYINESSVVNFDKYKKVMTLIDYDKAQTASNKKKYLSVNAFHMFSCSDKKYWIGAPRFHSGKMGGGDQFLVDSKLDYVDVPASGGIATIFQRACR
jgi:hypothetical protein